MGEVYRAHDPKLNREVALKTISGELGGDEMLRKRFRREAQSAAHLSHPNIITVYELGEEGNRLYMAMELLEGRDLKRAIAERSLGSLDERLGIMGQILEGLAFAHGRGIVHRDLKPANVHILPNGRVKIMDFGLARLAGSDMTRTGMVMGTPNYMAPEQVRGEKADSRCDVFAAGCILYELVTYRKAFEADSLHAVLYKVMQEEPPPARETLPGIPAVLLQVLDRALAKNPAERFQDAGQLRTGLGRAREVVAAGHGDRLLPELARPSVAPESRARPVPPPGPSPASMARPPVSQTRRVAAPLIVAGAVAVLALAGVAGWYAIRPSAPAAGTAPTPNPEVQGLAQALVDNQVELARRRLHNGEWEEAARTAERALKLDANNAEAREVLGKARMRLQEIEAAAAALRSASPGTERTEALWRLMSLDPDHAGVGEASPGLERDFRARAEEARRLAAAARRQAEQAAGAQPPALASGTRFVRDGDRAFQDGRYVTGARDFLKARDQFERARQGSR